MSNPLTGDFEAVLQVSGGTINRLLASMHQNDFQNPNTPSFPHSVQVRLGGPNPIDGVEGTVKAQIASPLIELIDGVTDRFWLQVAVRARYYPDPGSNPLPAFINGVVRAQYRIEDIDPQCFGWAHLAKEYIWVRVVPGTVSFHGTTAEDQNIFEGPIYLGGAEDHGALEARITRQIAALLATKFEATPQRVSKRFRRGMMRSLVPAIGDSAVAVPLGVTGDPAGSIGSVATVFLKTSDFAIAINRDVILQLAEPMLAGIQGFRPTIKVDIDSPWYSPLPDVSTVYHVSANPPIVEWHAHGSFAVIKIKVSGSATTQSILPNVTFSIEQDITLNFDSGSESLWLGAGSRKVDANVSGPFGGLIDDTVKNGIENAVKPIVDGAVTAAQPQLSAMINRKQELITQLRTLDAYAYARFGEASFEPDGMILRGRISLSPRTPPSVFFEITAEQDGYTAVKSWIPGGRIDTFSWTWGWYNGGQAGAATISDRFVLKRPHGRIGKWGQAIGLSTALPGIDGSGHVCLQIRGVQMDPATGQFRTVSASFCHRSGYRIHTKVPEGIGTLFVPDVPELSQDVPFPQLTLVDMFASRAEGTANTLIVYAGRDADREMTAALREGLEGVRRTDAGLSLLVVMPEGQLAGAHEENGLVAQVRRIGEELGLATLFAEDIGGRWAAAFKADGAQTVWRLSDPHGDVRWIWKGRVTGDRLSLALDQNLVSSGVPKAKLVEPTLQIGRRVGIDLVRPDVIGRHCPPYPLGRTVNGTVITFVQRGSAASETHLRDLARRQEQHGDTSPGIVVVVGGADQDEAEAYAAQFGRGFVGMADPQRTVTAAFGVSVWPMTFTLDRVGRIEAIETGVSGRGRRDAERRSESMA